MYNPASQPTSLTYGSSDADSFSYDANTGRVTQSVAAVNGQNVTNALTWNANGSLGKLSITDPLNSANTQNCSYQYDDFSRLGYALCGSWSQSFVFDPFGNIAKSGSITWAPTYSSATNRYQTIPSGTLGYDANGNLTSDSFHTYAWDSDANPTTVSGNSLTYDALDRRVEQTISGSTKEILYGPSGSKLALLSGQTVNKFFLPLPAGATAVYTASGLAYYRHPDWLGSSRVASTPTRTLYYDGAYAPFGESYAETGTTDRNFTGQNQDMATDLYDFLFREYHPTQGRWIQPDPAGLAAVDPTNPQSWNRYAYVLNDPLRNIDNGGLSCVAKDGGGYVDDGDGQGCEGAGVAAGQGDGTLNQGQVNSTATADVTPLPTAYDYLAFAQLWTSGQGPASINYGPNDGMTKALAGSSTFNTIRQGYKTQGCPADAKNIPSGHYAPFIEGYLQQLAPEPAPNYLYGSGYATPTPPNFALMQVGGFVASAHSSGSTTTFTITNYASNNSFFGGSTFGYQVQNNPKGPTGPRHTIQQTFTWSEPNPCK